MGYANIVAQIFFTIIIITALVYTQTVHETTLKQQAELFANQKEQLLNIANSELELVYLTYNTTWQTTKIIFENSGSQSFDTTAINIYLDGIPISRDYIARKGFICVNLDNAFCGELRAGSVPFYSTEEPNIEILYHFNNDSHFGEDPNTAVGFGPNGYDAVINGATLVPGKFDYALSFNGNSNYVQVPDIGGIDFIYTSTFTWFAWVYPTSYATDSTIIAKTSGNTGTGGRGYQLYIDSSGELRFKSRRLNTDFNSGYFIPLNQWSHIAVTYNYGGGTGNIEFYVNGQNVETLPHGAIFRSQTVSGAQIGRNPVTSSDYFTGLIDEVAVYQNIRNAQNISWIYNKGRQFVSENTWDPQERLELSIYEPLGTGDHTVKIITDTGLQKEYTFTV